MDQFGERLSNKLENLEQLGLKRQLPGPVHRLGRVCELNETSYLNFSSNDYLALASDERVVQKSREAVEEFGAGAGGSRLICGDHPLYQQLEDELAEWKGRESALVFGSGYLTNFGVIRAVTTGRDLVLYDELAHRCLIEGARLSDADAKPFEHNNIDQLGDLLEADRDHYDAVLVLTEGIFSMDGDRAPLEEIQTVCRDHDAWMLVDEAHSAGVWGEKGAGLTPGLTAPVEISMGTLSKAFGGYGGYVAGRDSLRSFLINRATSFIYSTGLPPSVIGANLASLRIIRSESDRRGRLEARVNQLTGWLTERGIPHPDPPSQVVPVITGSVDDTVEAGEYLKKEGIYAVPIRYPTVPRKLGRIRISLRSDHTEEDINRLTAVLEELDEKGLIKRRKAW